MFGYSLTRPVQNQEFYYGIFDACKSSMFLALAFDSANTKDFLKWLMGFCFLGKKFNVDIEGWHTESGPGVYEAALEFGEVTEMADRASLFKLVLHLLILTIR